MAPPNPRPGSENGASAITWRVGELERKCQALQHDIANMREKQQKDIADLREKQHHMSEKQQDLRTRAQIFMWLVPVGILLAGFLREWISG